MRRLAAALLVAGALACGCTQGFMLEDGERPSDELTDAKFVFGEGQTEIEMRPAPTSLKPTPTPTPTPAPAPTPAPQPPPTASPASAPADQSPTPGGGTGATGRATPVATFTESTGAEFEGTPPVTETVAAAPLDAQAIAANPLATSILIPNPAVDPGLATAQESSDSAEFFLPEMIAEIGLESFAFRVSNRPPESDALSERQRVVQLVQFIFVHTDVPAAQAFYEFLSTTFVSGSANSREEATKEYYPNLVSELNGFRDVLEGADETTLAVLEIDPNVPEGAPSSGAPVPTVYYIVLLEGRITAAIDVVYILEQDPRNVVPIGDLLLSRIPPELRTTEAP
ncbi:MAG: hypothetical protein OXG33_06970 [Chloroflexi bacterium]|nr:hypothetical protein [Chloroflexota bacterium]